MNKNIISFKEVKKHFPTNEIVIKALNGLDFEISEGEFVVIVGPSGAGKTTMLNLLGGMEKPTSGEIIVDGQTISQFTDKQLTEYRRKTVGFIFQFYNLMPNLTALENIELATEICKNSLSPIEALKSVDLENRKNNFPAQLSGGEQQRVSIARAVAKNPQIILCDEPTGALDYETGKKILRVLYNICREQRKTIIIVTHNSALKDMADKVIIVKNGLIEKIISNQLPKNIEEIEW